MQESSPVFSQLPQTSESRGLVWRLIHWTPAQGVGLTCPPSFLRIFIIWAISSWFRRGPSPQDQSGPGGAPRVASRNLFPKDTLMVMLGGTHLEGLGQDVMRTGRVEQFLTAASSVDMWDPDALNRQFRRLRATRGTLRKQDSWELIKQSFWLLCTYCNRVPGCFLSVMFDLCGYG